MEEDFEDIIAVASSEGSLSADTGMQEMLLTATRRPAKSRQPSPIRCVTLRSFPSRLGEAGEVARAIRQAVLRMSASARPLHVGGEEIGSVAEFSPASAGEPWSYLGVENAQLAVDAVELAKGRLRCPPATFDCLECGMTTIGKLFSVGPTHDLIGHLAGRDPRGAFEFHRLRADEYAADVSLWAADCKTQRQLLVSPTHKGVVVREPLAQRMRTRQSDLLYARNVSWTSQALLAATTAECAHGGSTWTALGHEDERVRRAFALWANSSLGMMVHWTHGQRTHKGRSRVQIGAVKKIPCPDLARWPESQLAAASRAFAELARLPLRPACQAHADKNRQRIDQAVLHLLFPDRRQSALARMRHAWCREPSVHGDNQTALKLLAKPGN